MHFTILLSLQGVFLVLNVTYLIMQTTLKWLFNFFNFFLPTKHVPYKANTD